MTKRLDHHHRDPPAADYDRIRRLAASERRRAIGAFMRMVFKWRGRQGTTR